VEVVYEDEWLLALNKPADVSSVPRHRFEGSSMVNRAVHYLGGRSPYVVHRLDHGTSGLLLFGKTRPAAASLAAQFRERTLSKAYLATLLATHPLPDSFVVDAPIAGHPQDRLRSYVPADAAEAEALRAQEALTRFRVLERADRAALCEASPVSGRMHQIRLHAEHSGCPIAGDTQYGAGAQPHPPCARLLLHAHTLRVRHPASDEPLRLVAPLPADYREGLERFGLSGAAQPLGV